MSCRLATVKGIAAAEGLRKPPVSRILRPALLAPEIVDAILAGQTDQALMLGRLQRPLPHALINNVPPTATVLL